MSKKQIFLYIDRLSPGMVPAVAAYARYGGIRIYYRQADAVAQAVIRCVGALLESSVVFEKMTASLGDIWSGDRSLAARFTHEIPELAGKVLEVVRNNRLYRRVCAVFPAEKADIYFEREISDEIYSLVKLFVFARWQREQGGASEGEHILLHPPLGLAEAVTKVMGGSGVTIVFYRLSGSGLFMKRIRSAFMRWELFRGTGTAYGREGAWQKIARSAHPKIALHYAEGFDLGKRSDIFWYPKSGIEPGRVLVYFDNSKSMIRPLPREVCDRVEERGMHWLCFKKQALEREVTAVCRNFARHIMRADPAEAKLNLKMARPRSPLERWITVTAGGLTLRVRQLLRFYGSSGIKIVFDFGVQTKDAMAQNIALGLTGGVRVGVQRSILQYENQPFIRYNANDVYFFWNSDAVCREKASKAIREPVVSGYPFDYHFNRTVSIPGGGKAAAGEGGFLVALFDNTFSAFGHLSEDIVRRFYRKFFEWLMEDSEVRIVSKEKQPAYVERIFAGDDIFRRVCKTGRFTRLQNAVGRFPSDACTGAAMAVGVGISSALTEAVLAGCRGIHCDLTRLYPHPYYQWGRGSIIFDDADRLIAALKRYKNDPASEPFLGDWSSHLWRLDPFRDGRAGERIGLYLSWLLEEFDRGAGPAGAIDHAARRYAAMWGTDTAKNESYEYAAS